MIFVTYNVQYKDGLSQNISALRYWNSDHYPSVGEKKKKRQRFLKVSRVIILIDEKDRSTCNLKKKKSMKKF